MIHDVFKLHGRARETNQFESWLWLVAEVDTYFPTLNFRFNAEQKLITGGRREWWWSGTAAKSVTEILAVFPFVYEIILKFCCRLATTVLFTTAIFIFSNQSNRNKPDAHSFCGI